MLQPRTASVSLPELAKEHEPAAAPAADMLVGVNAALVTMILLATPEHTDSQATSLISTAIPQ